MEKGKNEEKVKKVNEKTPYFKDPDLLKIFF